MKKPLGHRRPAGGNGDYNPHSSGGIGALLSGDWRDLAMLRYLVQQQEELDERIRLWNEEMRERNRR